MKWQRYTAIRWLRCRWRYVISLLILLVLPVILPSDSISIGFVALQYSLLALGLNVVAGWTGLLDLGAAGFVAIGAYTSAILLLQFGLPAIGVLLLSPIIGFLAGVLLGIPTLRQRMDYFAILTLGFAELVSLTIRNWPSVTKGPYGYSGIHALTLPLLKEPLKAVPPTGFYYLALFSLVCTYILLMFLRKSVIGRHFHLIKTSERVAQAYGVNVYGTKLLAFGISASILSIGGFLWVSYQRSIVWTEFNILLSCLILSMLVIGGLGNPNGVILGASLVGASMEMIRRLLTSVGLPQNVRYLIFSSALVAFVLLKPKGMFPDKPSWFQSIVSKKRAGVNSTIATVTNKNDEDSPLLVVENISKSFGNVLALEQVSLVIKPMELVALIGPNGSGKTSLLNCISGFLKVDRGEMNSGTRESMVLHLTGLLVQVLVALFRTLQLLMILTYRIMYISRLKPKD